MKRINFKRLTVGMMLLATVGNVCAQSVWRVDDCIRYAVEHNRDVRQRQLELDNYRQDRVQAWGSLLPSLNASVGGQMNFGRSVNPETNTYNNISTLNNSYSLETSLTLFRGGSLVNEIRRSRAAVLMGKAQLEAQKDELALATYEAFVQVVYLQGCKALAVQKLAQTDTLLLSTKEMERLGLKSIADVSQISAQRAQDALTLTTQTNEWEKAMLLLKQKMNFPFADTLIIDTLGVTPTMADEPAAPEATYATALLLNPQIAAGREQMQAKRFAYRQSVASFLPTITFYGGLSTSYYKMLSGGQYPTFRTQLKDNYGQYVAIGVNIPIFNRFRALTERRKARNSYLMACEAFEQQKEELYKLVEQAYLDRKGSGEEMLQLEEKVAADEWAYRLTKRKYEEGLATSLEVQQNAATLQDSRIQLLKARLTYVLKNRLVDYYQGKPLY